ncbi:radical SAM protein [Anaeroselena agilis]|uniref:Radical SAM protein n=1 Tax=Anaeroselena agilis TaxID=3063788 RepID=A0ABU3NYI2_9FIRM|nr:radical SAM protein [Selenomonadales bacterium 4137-cl]
MTLFMKRGDTLQVALIQVDGKLPNLALMKLSAYHKARGDDVILYRNPDDYLLGQDLFNPIDKAYAAVIFDDTVKRSSLRLAKKLAAAGVEVGGTGWDITKTLPPDIEALPADYDLYGITYGFGFTSRGCIRTCPFCVVPRKEGNIRHVAWPVEIANPKSKALVLLDNNFLASPLWREKAQQIIDHGYRVDFTQGLDIRLVTDEAADYIANMKHGRRIHFAFDHIGDEQIVRSGIEKLLARGLRGDDLSFYVLTNYNSTHEDDRRRVDILDEYGANPFIMVYDKRKAPEITRRLALWCNKYWSKKACRFEDFDRKAYRQKKRLDYQPGEGAICAT